MEKSEGIFEISLAEKGKDRRLHIKPEQTTDGVALYHCYADGAPISELRQETSGEWVQLWGDLPLISVQRIGAAIAHHMA